MAPPPVRGPGANRAQAESAVQGATTVLNRQLRESSSSRRGPEPGSANSRNIADVLPIVESPVHHHPQSVFAHQGPPLYPPHPPQPGHHGVFSPFGTRTPDLDFAEIGHGRSAHGIGANAPPAPVTQQNWTPRQPLVETDASTSSSHIRSPNHRSMSDPGNLSNYSFNNLASTQGSPPEGIIHPHPQLGSRLREARANRRRDNPPPTGDASRGRLIRSRLRTGLNIAESYASSFTIFGSGRFPTPPGGPSGRSRDSGEGGSHQPRHPQA
jgi:F-box and leucine-rich repeat protein GRR1